MTDQRLHHRRLRALGLAALCVTAPVALACGGPDEAMPAPSEPFVLPDIEEDPVAAEFVIEVNAADPELDGEQRQPLAGPVLVTGGSETLELRAFAKRVPARPDGVWVEIFVVNRSAAGLRDVVLRLGSAPGAGTIVDVTNAPLAEDAAGPEITVGGIAAEGLGRAALLVVEPDEQIRLELTVQGVPTARRSSNSAPLAITSAGDEVWASFADADTVAVIDTASARRVDQIEVPGGPSSVAVSPDDAHVLVASHDANTITIIDRERRQVLQTLTEDDGLPRDLRHLVVAADGTHAYASAYVDDEVVQLLRRGDRYEVDARAAVGRRPSGIALSPGGDTLLVAHYLPRGTIRHNEAWVSVVDTASMTVRDEVVLHDDLNEDRVHCLADVFGVSPSRMTMEGGATALAGAFLSPGGATAWVPGMRVSPGPVMELGPDHADLGTFTSGPIGRFAPAFLFMLDAHLGPQVEAMRSSGVLDIPEVDLDFVRCIDAQTDIEFTTAEPLPESTEQLNPGVANPNGFAGLSEQGRMDFVAFSRGGRRAFGLSTLADELVVYDAATMHPASQRHRLLSGSNPHGMVVSPDGQTGYVSYRNSTYVSVLDLREYAAPLPEPSYVPFRFAQLPDRGAAQSPITGRWLARDVAEVPERPRVEEIGQIPLVDTDPLDPMVRRGRILFESSNPERYPELSASRQASCATCHPGGGSDGSAWATVEGERRTMSLRGGIAGRGWLHASATHRDAVEFLTVVVEQRLGGSPDAATVEALASYVAFELPALQAPHVDPALAERGAELFAAHCRGCHRDATYGSGSPDLDDPWGGGSEAGPVLHDVGTRTDAAGVLFASFFESIFPPEQSELLTLMRGDRDLGPDDRLGEILDFEPRPARIAGQLKSPSLVGVWDQVVFFHDGRYDDLHDVVRYFDDHLALGLTDGDVDALVEFLKTL